MTNEEYKNIAPRLTELKKLGTGFIVPNAYFEKVEDSINHKIEELKPKIHAVPDNYFETIEDRVFEKINSDVKVIRLKSRLLKIGIPLAAAASLLLIIMLQTLKNNTHDVFAEVNLTEIDYWIESGDLELNTYEIASVYNDVDFGDLELDNGINDEELMKYLEYIDVESLILTN